MVGIVLDAGYARGLLSGPELGAVGRTLRSARAVRHGRVLQRARSVLLGLG